MADADTQVSQTPAPAGSDAANAAASQASASDAEGGTASQTPGAGQQEPETVEALKQKLAELQEQATNLQSTKDAQIAAANRRLADVIRRQNADKSKAEQDRLIALAKTNPDALADEFLANTAKGADREQIEVEIGSAILANARGNPAYEAITEAEKDQIQNAVVNQGGGAVDVVNAWAYAARERAVQTAGAPSDLTEELEATKRRLAALEKGATADAIDNADGPAPREPNNADRQNFDLNTLAGINAAFRAGKIDEGEQVRRLLAKAG